MSNSDLNVTTMERSPISLTNSRIRVKKGDNWLIPGRKGSGKTTFGKLLTNQLLKLYPTSRLYVLDIKLRDFNSYPGIYQGDDVPPELGNNDRVQVWQPVVLDPENIERWLYRIRHDPPAILQIDELLALCYGRRDTSQEFTRITKLGRALPISTIAQTQELVDIPRGALSQPDHIARFRLKHPYEIRLLNGMMGQELTEPQDRYGFYYNHAESDGQPIYYDSAQTFLGLQKERKF